MNKFNLTDADFALVRAVSETVIQESGNLEELEKLSNCVKKYEDTVKRMGDGRVTKDYKFSEDETNFLANYGAVVYKLSKESTKE